MEKKNIPEGWKTRKIQKNWIKSGLTKNARNMKGKNLNEELKDSEQSGVREQLRDDEDDHGVKPARGFYEKLHSFIMEDSLLSLPLVLVVNEITAVRFPSKRQ